MRGHPAHDAVLPEAFGHWQAVAERHLRWSSDGTCERLFAAVREHLGDDTDDLAELLAVGSTGVRAINTLPAPAPPGP
ncbi:hypothetical protein GCM10023169_29680 [Georgenia halophila]|uniref:Transposase n=1 Tax=Georgenia halophila TaxID=620889 RepID=A0ABP8LGR9_9MICO